VPASAAPAAAAWMVPRHPDTAATRLLLPQQWPCLCCPDTLGTDQKHQHQTCQCPVRVPVHSNPPAPDSPALQESVFTGARR
jgi:hypothetical protein